MRATTTKPIVGVTGPALHGEIGYVCSSLALYRAGARPRRLRPPYSRTSLRGLAGVVIGGGSHIEPARYDQSSLPKYCYDRERDEFEWCVLEEAFDRRLPLLGICRGAQLLNVFLGGSLWQNLPEDMPGLNLERSVVRARKWVTIEPDSLLARAMDTARVRVNSLHSQAIRRLGRDVHIAARDSDGIIQAIEAAGEAARFVVGVQWHPEYLPLQAAHQRLFSALVAACAGAFAPERGVLA